MVVSTVDEHGGLLRAPRLELITKTLGVGGGLITTRIGHTPNLYPSSV